MNDDVVPLRLSVIVPAYNEEKLLGGSLASIRRALDAVARTGLETELIVVDNNSTDRTAQLAREAGARVVFEPVNQIARARNTGARAASGDWLLFIDADSYPSAALMGETVDTLHRGDVVGGGCLVRMDAPLYGRCFVELWNLISRSCRWAAGSYLFCRNEAFRAVGGFDESLYASEEIDLSRRLKRHGRRQGHRFVILFRHRLETSARKVELYSPLEVAKLLLRFLWSPRKTPRDKRHLDMWYDGRR